MRIGFVLIEDRRTGARNFRPVGGDDDRHPAGVRVDAA